MKRNRGNTRNRKRGQRQSLPPDPPLLADLAPPASIQLQAEIFKLPLELQVLVIEYLDLRSRNRLRISCWATVRLFGLLPTLWLSDSEEFLTNLKAYGILNYWRLVHKIARTLTLDSPPTLFASIVPPRSYVLRKLVIINIELRGGSRCQFLNSITCIGDSLQTLKITGLNCDKIFMLRHLLYNLTGLKMLVEGQVLVY